MQNHYKTWASRALIAIYALFLTACQPTVEERFANAESYMLSSDYRSAVIELKNVLRAEPDRLDARRMLADASYILYDLGTAESEYRRLLATSSDDTEVWIAYGRTLLSQGKAAEALENVAPNIEASSDSDAIALLGEIYLSLGNLSAAVERYEQALAVDPALARAMVGLAAVAVSSGDLQRADELSDAAVQAHPDSWFVLRSRGDVLGSMQRFAEAIDVYQRAIAVEASTTPFIDKFLVRQNWIAALIEAARFDDATQALSEFSQLAPNHPIARFYAGRIAFGRGEYEVAETEMLRYLAAVPSDARGQAILGAIKFSQNNLGQAEQYLSGAVRANVGGETTRLLLAETQLRLNRSGDAKDLLQSGADGSELSAMTLAMLGRAELGAGDADAAIAYFQQSLDQDAGSDGVNLALAASFVATNRPDEAIEILLNLSPASDGTFRRETLLMGAYLQAERSSDAQDVATELLRSRPEDATVHALAGMLYSNLGQNRRARAQLNTAIGIDAENVGALYASGMLSIDEGDAESAIREFGRVLDLRAAHLPALVQFATLLEGRGELAEFRQRLDAAAAVAPNSPQLQKLDVRTELLLGDLDAAQASIDAGRQSFPDDADFMRLDGVAKMQSGDFGPAIASLAEAARKQPDNPANHFDLARARLANGDFAQAVNAIRNFRQMQPDDVPGLAIEVDARLRSGDPMTASEAVQSFASSHPDEPFVLMLRGDIAFASGDPAAAINWYERYAEDNWSRIVVLRLVAAHQASGSSQAITFVERWLEEEPADSTMRRFYGQLLEANGETALAVREYERLERENRLDAVGMNNLAWYYLQTGQPGASELAERAHEMRPENGQIADTWGWILYQEGQEERALGVLRQASAQSPGNGEIRYHLAVVLSATGRSAEAQKVLDDLLRDGVEFPSYKDAEALARSL